MTQKKISINDLLDLIEKRSFDPKIENNYPELVEELYSLKITTLPNKYIYYWDF